jgi:single-strand selective monofunctional uracil DNA glycosylase
MASTTLATSFLEIEQNLAKKLCGLKYGGKVSHVYNPIEYAVNPHRQYLEKYCMGSKTVLFVGMNPGPYGMAQTGVNSNNIYM